MTVNRWTIGELLNVSAHYLQDKGVESPRLTAELLLALQLKTDRVGLYLRFDQPLQEDELAGFRDLIRRRLLAEPVAYIRGLKEFWSLDFNVGPGVLIPRPETELLVELVLRELKQRDLLKGEHIRILELGTGSGAVAVALARSIPEAEVWATDVSMEALAWAEKNIRAQDVERRVHLLRGDLWEPVESVQGGFDYIVSNPPYISTVDYEALPCGVRDYEPRIALDGGENGMEQISRVIQGAARFLIPGGWLMLEMDPRQTEPALALLEEQRSYEAISRVKDHSHRHRVVKGRRI